MATETEISDDMSLEAATKISQTFPLQRLLDNYQRKEVIMWRSAEEALATCPDPATMTTMLEKLVEEFRERRNSRWFSPIERRLGNRDLPKIEKRWAATVLTAFLDFPAREGETESVASRALCALANAQPLPPSVVKLCVTKLDDPDYGVAAGVLRILIGLPPDRREPWIPALLKSLNRRFSGNSEATWIIESLAPHFPTHKRQIVAALRAGLKDSYAFMPRTVFSVLRTLGPGAEIMVPDVLAYISRQDAFTDQEPHLIHIDPKGGRSIAGLIRLLGDPKETVRYQAIRELEAYGPKAVAAIPTLTNLVSKRSKAKLPLDLDAAREALQAIQGSAAGPAPSSAARALNLFEKFVTQSEAKSEPVKRPGSRRGKK